MIGLRGATGVTRVIGVIGATRKMGVTGVTHKKRDHFTTITPVRLEVTQFLWYLGLLKLGYRSNRSTSVTPVLV